MSRGYADQFLEATARARTLYERIVRNGYAVKAPGKKPTPLSQPDRRDVTEYLFFEVAAKFEQLCKRSLVLEVQKKVRVNTTRAEHMVGSSEKGIPDTMGGWASMATMGNRAKGLLGESSVYAQVEHLIGNPKFQYLGMALKTRNRIAHGKGNDGFTAMLGKQPVSLASKKRRGMSPGKFLGELPSNAGTDDKWFFRFLDAYETWVNIVRSKI